MSSARPSRARSLAWLAVTVGIIGASSVRAQPAAPSASAPMGGPSAAAAPAASAAPAVESSLCREPTPLPATRPGVVEAFPSTGQAGYVAWLEVVVSHGRGETVLPGGVGLQLEGEAAETLKKSGFLLPNPEGSVRPELTREETASGAKTTLKLPVVPLPSRPGRVELTLPPLPIAVARASGETFHLCTRPHTLRVEEPIANQSAPTPKGNPPPRRQLEQWLLLKYATYFALAALAIGGLLAWLILRWLARPRPTKPLPPPRPPWEVALEELHDVRFAGLVELGRPDEHYARVANTIRKYLGARFGFDGLESTTREVLGRLRHVAVAAVALPEIERFLRHADLVKFARLTPSPEECRVVLERAEDVVRKTMPLAHAPAEAVMAPSAEPPQAPVSAGRGESLPVAASEPPRTDPKQGGGAS